jgi:hypothetical protein
VTWDREATIPFLCYVAGGGESRGHQAFLGLWNLANGTVSFHQDPLFEVEGRWARSWDGGNRFAFDDRRVTKIDPRIRLETILVWHTDSQWWTPPLLVAPSGSGAIFAVYSGDGGRPVLDIRKHPLEGTIVMDLPELPNETTIVRAIGIEVSDDRINVYFETSRPDTNLSSGQTEYVQGVLVGTYWPKAIHHQVKWRVINPDVPSYIAGSGTSYSQIRDGFVLSSEHHFSDLLDIATGEVSQFPGLERALREADPAFVNPGQVQDTCYGYRDLCIIMASYPRGHEYTWVNQVFAFRGSELLGRLEYTGGWIAAFGQDGQETSETAMPWDSHCVLVFPETLKEAQDLYGGDRALKYMHSYEAIWANARYADLFAEQMRNDASLAEQGAHFLMKRFTADPAGFIRALGVAPEVQAERVCDQLAYNASHRDLTVFRRVVEELRESFVQGLTEGTSRETDVAAVDRLLERIDDFAARRGR